MHPTRSLQTPSQIPELQWSGYSFSSPAQAFCNTGSSLLKVASNHQDWHVLAEVWRCFLLTPTETLPHPDRESHHPTAERKDAYLIRENKLFSFQQSALRTVLLYPAVSEAATRGKISAFHHCWKHLTKPSWKVTVPQDLLCPFSSESVMSFLLWDC